jgi:hypothetical protein
MDYKDFDLGEVMMQSSGMDAYLGDDAEAVDIRELVGAEIEEPKRIRIANVEQLQGFSRVASDTLIRKSERDLWSLKQSEEGDWVIERLFDDEGNPLKV